MYFSERQRQIYEEILSWISEGRCPPGRRLPTELELAGRFKVARETLRAVLLRLEEEKRIERIKRKGTFVLERKRSGGGKTVRSVGLFMTIQGNEELFSTIVNTLSDNGVQVRPQLLESEFMDRVGVEDTRERLRRALDSGVDAVVVEGGRHFPYVLLKEIHDSGTRVVFLKDFQGGDDFPESARVLVDFYEGGRLAAAHLIKKGFDRLACFSYAPVTRRYADERGVRPRPDLFLEGVRSACSELGVESLRVMHDSMWSAPSAGRDKTLEDFIGGGRCGIVMRDDCRARVIYPIAARMGVRIGADLGLTGFYDLRPYAATLVPSLTSLDIRASRLGGLAARAVVEGWRGREELVVPALVARESSAGVSKKA